MSEDRQIMGRIKKLVEDCIQEGVRAGVDEAFREVEQPKQFQIMYEVEKQILWNLECDVFDWRGLTDWDYSEIESASDDFLNGAEWAEAKLKEKNT